jgi:hypothetical protein
MLKRLCTAALATALMTFSAATALADDNGYPDLATVDGTSASLAGVGATLFKVSAPLAVDSYKVGTSPEVAVAEHHSPPNNFKRTMWGYEAAATGARILQYDIGPPVVAGPFCIPTHTAGLTTSGNGRGVAWDPLTNTLWNSHLAPGFIGDGFIHRNSLPPACTPIESIPFGDGPGGVIQDDIGSIDVDEATKHLWVAGYKPVAVGVPPVLLSYFYKVNRNNGEIIDSCAIPFRGGGVGNETLAVYKDTSFPGSSKYFLTDAGEPVTVPNSHALIDQADCHDGDVVTPVMEFAKTTPGGVTGIDAEWPGLLVSTLPALFNHDSPPFAAFTPHGAYGNSAQVEDISLCGFRATIGGGGNDKCPLP